MKEVAEVTKTRTNLKISVDIKVCVCCFQISVQMSKVLLHMEDKYNINGFLKLRQTTMVALTVTDCIPV